MGFLSSGDATFREKIFRLYIVDILAIVDILERQPEKLPPPSRKSCRRPAGKVAAAQPEKLPPPSRKSCRRPAGKVAAAQPLPPTLGRLAVPKPSRASRPALAADARTPCRSEAVYASRLLTQKRLRLARPALRQVALTALGSYRPPSPCGSRNAFNRRQKAWRRLAFHAKCVSPTSLLSLLQR